MSRLGGEQLNVKTLGNDDVLERFLGRERDLHRAQLALPL